MSLTGLKDQSLSNHSHKRQHTHLTDDPIQTTYKGISSAKSCFIEEPHQVMLRCNDKLVTALSLDPQGIAGALLAKGLIPEITEAQMHQHITAREKATILVTTVRRKIEIAPKQFHDFLDILSKQPWTKDILEILLQLYTNPKQLRKDAGVQAASAGNHDSTDKECKSSDEIQFGEDYRYAEINSEDKVELEAQLILSADSMRKKFAALLLNVIRSFNQQNVQPRLLTSAVLALTEYDDPDIGKPLLEREKEALMKAQSVDHTFDVLRPHMTFFNYEILEFLIEQMGTPNDKDNLKEFLRDFGKFCRKSIFEIPPHVLGHSTEKEIDQQKFCIKITKQFKAALLIQCTKLDSQTNSELVQLSSNHEDREAICTSELGISLEDAKHIQRKLASVLKLKTSSIYLDSATCVGTMLTFRVPSHVSLAGLERIAGIVIPQLSSQAPSSVTGLQTSEDALQASQAREELQDALQAILTREKELQDALQASQSREKKLQQQLDKAKETIEREKKEAEKQVKAAEEKIVQAKRTMKNLHLALEKAKYEQKELTSAIPQETEEFESVHQQLEFFKKKSFEEEKGREKAEKMADMHKKRAEEVENEARELRSLWVMPRWDIELTGKELGRGGWGRVMVANFRGTRVAAKCLYEDLNSVYYRDLFRREMSMAARLRHPNLVQFIGASLDGHPIILTELMKTSLRKVLEKGPILYTQVTSISLDVAQALNYLHLMQPHPIIHRDISSANILLNPLPDNHWIAKVSDYGSVNIQVQLYTQNPGSPAYSSPEANNPALQSPKMDIFSFGVLLIEMLTGRYPEVKLRQRLMASIEHPDYLNLVEQCMSEKQDERPSAKELITKLSDIKRVFTPDNA